MKGIDVVCSYCERVMKNDNREHIDNCQETLYMLKKENINFDNFPGCPSNFGLDNHIGLCEIENKPNCFQCWKKALEDDNELEKI